MTAPTFPPDSQPENRTGNVTCDQDKGLNVDVLVRSLMLKGILIQVLQQHFADPMNISDKILRTKLKNNPFTEDDKTGMIIESNLRWRPNTEEQRLAVLVKRNALQWTGYYPGNVTGEDYQTGDTELSGGVAGSLTLFAIGRSGDEAEVLGIELARCAVNYAQILMDSLELSQLKLMGVEAAGQVQESAQHYAVPVSIAYHLFESWNLAVHAPRLKNIKIVSSRIL